MNPAGVAITNRDPSLGASYSVSLPAFDGPLDLLLQLIERRELEISEISLCEVTDQYLRTVELVKEIEPGALSDFLVIASRLLFIKSNHLLPRPVDDDDEEEDVGDALVRQLLEYRQFRRAAESLKYRVDNAYRAHVRQLSAPVIAEHTPPADLTDVDLNRLQSALQSVLQRIPADPAPPRVQPYQVTVADQIERVRTIIQNAVKRASERGARVQFSALLDSAYTRTEVIVTFLAVLELIKQQELVVKQDATFGEIYLLPIEADRNISARGET